MNYNQAFFELAVGRPSQLPAPELPEIVFSGRSNVGKSSMINRLLGRKSLARVSASPGKTGTINFYRLPGCRLVDLPGYGYAKVSQSEKLRWAELVEGYFAAGRDLRLVVQIADMRHDPTRDDLHMLEFLSSGDFPFLLAATKSDKLNRTEYQNQKARYEEIAAEYGAGLLVFSSVKGEGCEELRGKIEMLIKE
ncbi:MAG TPA: YihA family ribosome biogenesis GTP-binding protein [Candidatus Gallacutalibacter pullicola]|uniref:Probable GTP-binding protein EngB n=1 Tax=Candidatus Gallacutalibacter pullicola TaxID=2840830 RepID=A0A9D1DSZ0_9FIRM|nr:YihA family ribosome biogenesis GTP-binding protein [Candidatus Gallacutalibacter pullicola]